MPTNTLPFEISRVKGNQKALRYGRRAVVILQAVALVGMVVSQIITGSSDVTLIFAMVSSLCVIALSIFSPVWAAWLCLGIFLWLSIAGDLGNIATLAAGVVVLGALAFRARYLLAFVFFVLLCAAGAIDLSGGEWDLSADFTGMAVMALLFSSGLSVGAGFGYMVRQRESERRKREQERQRQREATVRTLHDSVATSMTSAIMRAESLSFEEDLSPEVQKAVNHISADIRAAMEEVRVLIKFANSEEWPEDATSFKQPSQLLGEAIQTLESHGFKVETRGDLTLVDEIMTTPRELRLILSEVAANIVKYGSDRHPVVCEVEDFSDAIHISLANRIARSQSATYLSSGIGMSDITGAMKALKGTFDYGVRDGVWVSTLKFSA